MKNNSLTFKITNKVTLLIVVFLFLVSCVSDDITPHNIGQNSPGVYDEVTFVIQAPESRQASTTRSQGPQGLENTIGDLYLLIFADSDDNINSRVLKHIKSYGVIDLSQEDPNKPLYTLTVSLPKGVYDFMVLANVEGLDQYPTATDKKEIVRVFEEMIGQTKEVVMDGLKVTSSLMWDKNIPMGGLVNNIDSSSNQSRSVSVSLYRMLAKVNIELDLPDDIKDEYQLTYAAIVNPNSAGYLLPALNGSGELDLEHTNSCSTNQPSEGASLSNLLKYEKSRSTDFLDGLELRNPFYLFETQVDLEKKVCLIVGVEWEYSIDETQYYRIDFERKESNSGLLHPFSLLRNHSYQFIISGISGGGKKSIEEAFIAGSALGIHYDMIEHTVSELGDIVFEGNKFLAVNPGEVTLPKQNGIYDFKVTTNYPTSELIHCQVQEKMLIGNSFEDVGDDFWLKLDKRNLDDPIKTILNGESAYCYTGSYSVEDNLTGYNRVAYVKVSVNDILFYRAKIIQSEVGNIFIAIEKQTHTGDWVPTDRVTFMQESQGQAPAAETYRIRWAPYDNASLKIVKSIKSDNEDSSLMDIQWNQEAPYINPSDESSDFFVEKDEACMTYQVCPKALPTDQGFKIGEQEILVYLTDHLGRVELQTLSFKQIGQVLDLETEDVIPMDGRQNSIVIKSNTKWKLFIEKNGITREMEALVDKEDKSVVSFFENNVARVSRTVPIAAGEPSIEGTKLFFTTMNDLVDPELFQGEFTLRLVSVSSLPSMDDSSLDQANRGHEITKTIRCISAISQQGRESNCYVIDPSSYKATGVGILIPLDAAFYSIEDGGKHLSIPVKPSNSEFGGVIPDLTKLNPVLVWSTSQKVLSQNGAISKLKIILRKKGLGSSYIYVGPGSEDGNCLIGIQDDSGLLWTWHIWVTSNMEFEGEPMASYLKGVYDGSSTTWLDRDLGALSVDPTESDSFGYYYQWGRKDPFPSPLSEGSIPRQVYNQNGEPQLVQLNKRYAENILEAIKNPLVFYQENSVKGWLNDESEKIKEIWHVSSTSSLIHNKTIYDPCPAGYRVPNYISTNEVTNSKSWSYGGKASDYFVFSGMYFSSSGYLDIQSNQLVINMFKRSQVSRHTSTSAPFNRARTLTVARPRYTISVESSDVARYRAYPVRCVKIEG